MTLAASAAAAPRRQAEALSYDLSPHALALAMFALCAFSPSVLNDGDTWSHIATGDWILSHRAVPHADPFSFSFAGKPWTAHEWLSEVALALAYRVGGFVGVSLLTALAAAAAMFVVVRRAARELGGPALAAIGALALMLIAPSLLARPHILALPVFALFAEALFEARTKNSAPPLGVALLMTLWANLHGGFAFGLALIAPLALEAVLAAPRRAAALREWSLFALACLAAAAVTPFGIEGLLFPVRLLGLHALANIGEWAPESFAHPNALEAVLLGLIGLALTRPFRLPPLRLAMLIGLLHLSLSHARHEMLLAIVAPMLLARPIADALGTAGVSPALGTAGVSPALGTAGVSPAFATAAATPERARGTRAVPGAVPAMLAALLAIAIARPFLPAPLPAPWLATQAALAALPADVKAKPVLNGYAFGGYLIFERVRPYVDGRADMFGDSFLAHYAGIARGERDTLRAALAENKIGWTIFAPDQGAVAAMDAEPGWRRVYSDRFAVVHMRAN